MPPTREVEKASRSFVLCCQEVFFFYTKVLILAVSKKSWNWIDISLELKNITFVIANNINIFPGLFADFLWSGVAVRLLMDNNKTGISVIKPWTLYLIPFSNASLATLKLQSPHSSSLTLCLNSSAWSGSGQVGGDARNPNIMQISLFVSFCVANKHYLESSEAMKAL